MRVVIGVLLFLVGLVLAIAMSPVSVESWSFLLIIGCPILGLLVMLWGLPLGRGDGLSTYYRIRDSDNLAQIKYYEQMEYLSRNQSTPWKKD